MTCPLRLLLTFSSDRQVAGMVRSAVDPGCHGLWVTMSMILSGYHRKLQAFSQSTHLVDDERCRSAPALCGVRPRRHL